MASRGVNKVILIGHCGQDPEAKFTANGAAVTNISLATSESWKDRQTGQQQERTEWHRVVFFNRLAEIVGEYVRKGTKLYIEGSLRTRKWQDQNGQDRYTTEIVGAEMQMLDSRGGEQGGSYGGMSSGAPQQGGYSAPAQHASPQQSQPSPAPHAPAQAPAQAQTPPPPAMDSFDDDIPF